MKQALIIGLIGLLARTLTAADSSPQDKIVSATQQLVGKSNYSWTMSSKEGDGSPGRVGPIDGKADKSGLTYLSFSIGAIPVEVYMNGPKGAAKALEGWQTFDEIAQTSGTAAAVVRGGRDLAPVRPVAAAARRVCAAACMSFWIFSSARWQGMAPR